MARKHEPVDQDKALAGLARQVDGLDQKVTGQATEIEGIRKTVRSLTDALTKIGARGEPTAKTTEATGPKDVPPAPEWLTIEDTVLAGELLEDLGWWLTHVWAWYGEPPRRCWPYHPAVVAELLANRQVWLAATAEGAKAVALADWHERYRKSCATRLGVYLSQCSEAAHVAPDGGRWRTAEQPSLADVGVWWGNVVAGCGDGSAPGLEAA